MACDQPGQSIVGATCVTSSSCDPSCQTCSGGGANQCLTCTAGKYFYAGNSSCLSCNVDGYSHPDGVDCIQCDSTCSTCSGTLVTNCLTCPSGFYLYSLNSSCVACDVPGYAISGQNCVPCEASCQTCNGPTSTDCASCLTGTYLYQGNSTCLSCSVDGFYISGDNCLTCDASCKSCSGPAATDCLACFPDDTLDSQNRCISNNDNVMSQAEVELVAKTSSVASSSGQVQDVVTSALPLLANGASTSVVLLSQFAEDIKFYRFINVQFPQNFIDFCRNVDSSSIPNPYEDLACAESEVGKFKEFEISTCFLVNSGDALNREALALGLIAVSWTLSWLLRNQALLSKPFISMRNVLTWNTFINYFVSDCKEYTLYSLLDLSQQLSHHRRLSEQDDNDDETDEKSGSRFSYGMSIVMLVSYSIMFMFFGYLLNRKKKRISPLDISSPSRIHIPQEQNRLKDSPNYKQSAKKDGKPDSGKEGKWMRVPQAFNSISSDLKNDSWFSRNFLLISEFGGFVTAVCLVFLQGHGTLQAGFYSGIAIVLLILVLIYKPFETKLQTGVFAINYLSRFALGILATLIGARPDLLSTNKIGLTLIILTLTTSAINSLVSVWLILAMLINVFKGIISKTKRNKIQPLSPPNVILAAEIDASQNSPFSNLLESKSYSQRNAFFDRDLSYSVQIEQIKNTTKESEFEEERPSLVKIPELRSGAWSMKTSESHCSANLSKFVWKPESPGTKSKISLDNLSDFTPSNDFPFKVSYLKRSRVSLDRNIERNSKLSESKGTAKETDSTDRCNMIVEDLDLSKANSQK